MTISIIVAVYKAEACLCRCVDSLLAQTFTDFELLLVDDGSPDSSGMICDSYAEKDSRVRVFHKENGGVSSAREYGLCKARGEYVIHVDPDDWVEPAMLAVLYCKAREESADMVICDFFTNARGTQSYVKQQPSSLHAHEVIKDLFAHLHGSCCNKLVRRALFAADVHFPVGINYCEDLYVNIHLLLKNPVVAYVPQAFYHYVLDFNPNSMGKRISAEILDNDMRLYGDLEKSLMAYPDILAYFRPSMSILILNRAFKSGVYSSGTFRKRYGFLRPYIFRSLRKERLYFKCVYYISCIGGYRLMYSMTNLLKRLL